MNVGELFPIPLDRFARQFPFGVFSKKIFEEFPECLRERNVRQPGLLQFVPLLFENAPLRLGLLCRGLRSEPRLFDLAAIAPVRAREVDDETPGRLAVLIFPLKHGHGSLYPCRRKRRPAGACRTSVPTVRMRTA